jgi:hypothetical protein
MRFHVDVRASFGLLVLVPLLGGCDLESTEVGATVAELGTSTGADPSGSSSDTGAPFGSKDCPEEDWIPLITGTVRRELGDHTWNESFDPAPDAFVHLLHTSYDHTAPYPWGIGERLIPFEGLPFDFALCAPADAAFKFENDKEYDFMVYVFNHDTSELRVGDLTHEPRLYAVNRPTHDLQIIVGGVEHCDAPYADELCSTVVDDSNEGSSEGSGAGSGGSTSG